VLDWPAHQLKTFGAKLNPNMTKKTQDFRAAAILQEWDDIPLPKVQQLVSSAPRRLQTVVKRRKDATQ